MPAAARPVKKVISRAPSPAGVGGERAFVGDPDDVVDVRFGPRLPSIREWTIDSFDFAGYVTGSGPIDPDTRAQLRERLGYRPDEKVCLVTVGGSGVGLPLLRRNADAVPLMRSQVPGLRVVMVTGPRIDPAAVPARRGLTVHGFVPDLDRHLAVCDVAVVQAGLTTCMELTADRRPFVYVPFGATSNRTSTCGTGWSGTAPVDASTTTSPDDPTSSSPRWSPSSAGMWPTDPSDPTARTGPPASSPTSCEPGGRFGAASWPLECIQRVDESADEVRATGRDGDGMPPCAGWQARWRGGGHWVGHEGSGVRGRAELGGEQVVEHAQAAPVAVDLGGEQVPSVAGAHHVGP